MFEKLVAPKTEEEITKHWKNTEKVYVSVVCTTFNQEAYIRDAIESFLAQETEYKFEIIIHDDASTDSTAEIVKEYYQRFPTLIKPILQNVNQYSDYVCKPWVNCFNVAQGEFIALCEGDDFWVDKLKMNKQLKALKLLKGNICFTAAYSWGESEGKVGISGYGTSERNFPVCEVIENGGDFIVTASILFRVNELNFFFDFLKKTPVGDFYLQVAASRDSGAIYIPETTAVYRRNAFGSWSNNIRDIRNKVKFSFDYVRSNNEFSKLLNRKDVTVSMNRHNENFVIENITYFLYMGMPGKAINLINISGVMLTQPLFLPRFVKYFFSRVLAKLKSK